MSAAPTIPPPATPLPDPFAANPTIALAAAALAHWGQGAGPPQLIQARENSVFKAWLAPDGAAQPLALRLHRPGYQSQAGIAAELAWTAALAAAGQPVPAPLPCLGGGLVADLGGRLASALRWCPGQPLAPAALQDPARLARIGALLAGLHGAADRLGLAADRGAAQALTAARPAWDGAGLLGAGLLGADPIWGRFWESPDLSSAEAALLCQARDRASAALARFAAAGGDQGLIHADVLAENLLEDGQDLWLIDFDDCGQGFRLYDLATALIQNFEQPGLGLRARALLAGYDAARGPTAEGPARREADLALFVALRAFASLGWIASRAPAQDPRRALYRNRALAMAKALTEGALWPEGGACP